ncbi:PREDICTED: uncharacterized protein LOC105618823 [Atta cephalotes]|uniref:ascorbate ferrireductase (transmembrane) n=1 Tax=Atta cephalotes TaxID=12957 RepID=A0A158NDY5_ATTCE|nr:PREDICTED: uncharacterized protein LOC105618823 [Atta cephalotes]
MTNENKGPPSAITFGFSILTHFLLVAPMIYILVISFGNYSCFSWHVICSTVGVVLMTEAVFCISGEAYIVWKLPGSNRVTIHWILNTIGLILILIGLILAIVNKFDYNSLYFATSHSQLGLVTIILAFLVAAFGILANNTVWVYPYVRPVLIKVIHDFSGIIIIILLLASLITGLYTYWWYISGGTTTGTGLTFASLCVGGFFVLFKPILGTISKCRVLFGPPSNDS